MSQLTYNKWCGREEWILTPEEAQPLSSEKVPRYCEYCGKPLVYLTYIDAGGSRKLQVKCPHCKSLFERYLPLRRNVVDRKPQQKWAAKVMRIQGAICHFCHKTPDDGVKLHVHHIFPVKACGVLTDDEARFLEYSTDNGLVLCDDCHRRLHSGIHRAEIYRLMGRIKTEIYRRYPQGEAEHINAALTDIVAEQQNWFNSKEVNHE